MIKKLGSEVRVFNDKSVAKEFLEKQYNASVKAENKPLPNQIEVPIDKTRELPSQSPAKELFYINCPNCSVKLRAYAEGNHACPKCKTRFFVHSDKTISLFESISLQ